MTIFCSASADAKSPIMRWQMPFFALPLPAIVERLVRALVLWRITPARPVAVDECDSVSIRRSSTRGLPWLLEKNGRRRVICLSVTQYRVLVHGLLTKPELDRASYIKDRASSLLRAAGLDADAVTAW